MQAVQYSTWKETAHMVHMALQMMGKVKLDKMSFQPEWNHALLDSTAEGFTTGLVPDGESAFTLTLDVTAGRMSAACTTGRKSGFSLATGMSISDVFANFGTMLQNIGHPAMVDPTPQECANTTSFPQQHEKLRYDHDMARNFFDCCVLAYSALLAFSAPFRCKKILPAMFWGTFDMTTVLFSGEAEPFPGEGLIPSVAFDEKLVEFGFWPGDAGYDEPSFFALAYPFLAEQPAGIGLRTPGAFFSEEKKEYLLPLKDVLQAEDPKQAIRDFCEDTFPAAVRANNWQQVGWYTKPVGE